jgi:hypothetical protein
MVQLIEALRQVHIHHVSPSVSTDEHRGFIDGIVTAPLRSIPKAGWMELFFEDGGSEDFQALLNDSIPDCWDTQQTLTAPVFGNDDPLYRLWLIAFGFEFKKKLR